MDSNFQYASTVRWHRATDLPLPPTVNRVRPLRRDPESRLWRLPEWCYEAALVHWFQDANEPPSWPEAHRRPQLEGRRSRVNHPSEAQGRFEVREPRTSGGRCSSNPSRQWPYATSHRKAASRLGSASTVYPNFLIELRSVRAATKMGLLTPLARRP
jgi:hypothetical protein